MKTSLALEYAESRRANFLAQLRDFVRFPTVLMGLALPDDRMHAPNEKFHLPNFYKGIATSIWFSAAVGALRRSGVETREEDAEGSLAHDH